MDDAGLAGFIPSVGEVPLWEWPAVDQKRECRDELE
jgi:hypothetical protein